MNNMKLAVIGSGYWGKNLVRNFHALGVLQLVCDKNEALLEMFQDQYPGLEGTISYAEVIARDDINCIAIATPAETHYKLAVEAIMAGKHVYVEKPLALHGNEAEKLHALASEHGVTLMVGHLLQYHPVFVKLRQMVGAGELGRVDYIYSHRLNLGKIRREENILWSFAPHDISMILSLVGEMPDEVCCHGGYYLHKKIADVTTTHLSFPCGAKAHIFVSWLHPFKEQKLVVVGDKKMAVFDDTLPWEQKLTIYPHKINWQGQIPVPDKADGATVLVEQKEPLREECLHFLQCAKSGTQPLTDGAEGVRVLRVLNASQRSMDSGEEKCCINVAPGNHEAGAAFVHETSVVDEGADLGAESKVWHFSRILPGSRVGERCNIGQNVVIGPDVSVGNGCKIQNNISVFKGVTLEDDVFCGPSMVFTNVFNPRAHIRRMDQVRPTLVKKGATLGANCTIVCGNTIGRYAFVGAGAVVTRDVPDHALVMGNPGKRAGWVCACGEKLEDDLTCAVCGAAYAKAGTGLKPM
ncbi:UDP-2-acetamido-3-amino-2,3-dideoxy-glucuronate N-acetyltransferase [Paucidesulfovibrio gracilis DSM 16080]|uniref:UDP-2-acetamido-3-amino-2,3-dideoxy-glucuronate N-acetyltransferase n=1 Tax=Paucidesulfovibrio gracilis DSM 16080 TaxID=1121449 RepID=A0A1T4W2W2_9BACT|nr:Gfo/Idh/MocA family oxidoreductase [Paucidesulfovibrio gracilis]SKA71586.1 UDP-2-acetamido-3-amino-2,3-dideoxy-glucuronate N-acetyltransferase [Paucidesulfovibrio gracilis DSM 16080]